jgi:hypothetical protein
MAVSLLKCSSISIDNFGLYDHHVYNCITIAEGGYTGDCVSTEQPTELRTMSTVKGEELVETLLTVGSYLSSMKLPEEIQKYV